MYRCYRRIPAQLRLRARTTAPTERPWSSAFTLIEVVFAIFIFLMMMIMAASVISASTRAQRFGNSYAQAVSLAQRKIDQLQNETYTKITQSPAQLVTDGVLDSYTTTGTALLSAKPTEYSTASLSGPFTVSDQMSKYFSGSGSLPSGTVVIRPWGGTTTSTATMLQATVTIRWQDEGKPASSYSIQALIPKADIPI